MMNSPCASVGNMADYLRAAERRQQGRSRSERARRTAAQYPSVAIAQHYGGRIDRRPYTEATVLFANIVVHSALRQYRSRSGGGYLNVIFSEFDQLL
jgi:hypothetical protein